jgi:hypothetical protein
VELIQGQDINSGLSDLKPKVFTDMFTFSNSGDHPVNSIAVIAGTSYNKIEKLVSPKHFLICLHFSQVSLLFCS